MPEDLSSIVNGEKSFDTNPELSAESVGAGNSETKTNVDDPILSDLEAVFSSNTEGNSLSSGQQLNINPNSNASKQQSQTQFSDADPFGKEGMPKDPEALLKKLQSERDSTRAQNQKLSAELKQVKPIAEFVSSLYEDETARHAFIADLEPELLKPKNPLTFIQEGLKKEFGEEFTPNPEETNIFGSQTWLYNERAKDLLSEYKEKSKKTPTTLKELKEQRKRDHDSAALDAQTQRREVMEKFKWDDGVWDEFSKWASSVKLVHMGLLFNNIKSKKGLTAPNIAGQSGGRPLAPAKIQAELDNMFGK